MISDIMHHDMKYLLCIQETLQKNLAEGYMHIHSKFDGGKQINRSQSGSWEARCAGAVLRVNEEPEWAPKCWEK